MSDLRPTPGQLVLKVVTRARTRGVGEVLQTGVDRLKGLISSSDELIILARPADGELPARHDLDFVKAERSDAARYAGDIGTDSKVTFAGRLSHTTHCFFVSDGRKMLHATWVTTRAAWTRELGGYLLVPEGDCYVYESFTRSDARGRGIYPFVLKGICAWAAAQGLRRVWVGVESANAASRRAVSKAGFEPRLTIAYRRSAGRLSVDGAACPEGKVERLCLSREL
ncbi:MAG: GNAT family N-acetyltransferase [Actinomycetota bacterium]